MTTIGILTKIGFDNLENHCIAAIYEDIIAVFVGDEQGTAHAKCHQYLTKMQRPTSYLGHNEEVYPKYEYDEYQATQIQEET